jgi:endonuclease YncB( thermonuclease family)
MSRAQKSEAAVRRYWRLRALLLLLVGAVAYASFKSHESHLTYAADLDGAEVVVDQALQGDLLRVRTPDGRLEDVRLMGIDAPDRGYGSRAPAAFSWESKKYLHHRTDRKRVVLRFEGTERRDPQGRLRAYVYLTDNDCINLAMVRHGYAYVDRRESGFLSSQLGQAEGEARRKQHGLWKDLTFDQMPEWRQQWLRSIRPKQGI